MSDLSVLAGIGVVQLLATISPGPSFLITAQTAVARSRLAGCKVAVGLAAGTVLWSSAALLGLKTVFDMFPMLFLGMKIIGALFLLWVAWQIFRHAAEPLALDGTGAGSSANPFVKGFATQMSNPKVALFFGSIFVTMLPHDVPGWMIASLIAIVTFNELWWYVAVSLFFGAGPVRAAYLRAKIWIDRGTGLFLGFLGCKLLWAAVSDHRV